MIQLAGVHDVNKAAQIIGTTAQLQFYDFEADLVGPSSDGAHTPIANGSLYDLLIEGEGRHQEGAPSAYYLFNAKKKPVSRARGHARAAAERDAAERPQAERQGAEGLDASWRCRRSRS